MDKLLSQDLPVRLALLLVLSTALFLGCVGCATGSSSTSADESRGDISAEYATLEQLAPALSSAALIVKLDLNHREEILATFAENAAGLEGGPELLANFGGVELMNEILLGGELENLDRSSPAYLVLSTAGNDEFMRVWREQGGEANMDVPRFLHLRFILEAQSSTALLQEEVERELPLSWRAHELDGRVIVDGLVELTQSEELDLEPVFEELDFDTDATLTPTPALRAFADSDTPISLYMDIAKLWELFAITEASPAMFRLLDDSTLEYDDVAFMIPVEGDEIQASIIASRSPLGMRLAREFGADLPDSLELPATHHDREILRVEGAGNLGLARILAPTPEWAINQHGFVESMQRLNSQIGEVSWLIQLTQPVVYWSLMVSGEDFTPIPLAFRFAVYEGDAVSDEDDSEYESLAYALVAVFENTPQTRYVLEQNMPNARRGHQWRLQAEGEHLVLLVTRHLEITDAFVPGGTRSTLERLVVNMRPEEIKNWERVDRPRQLRVIPFDIVEFDLPPMRLEVIPNEDHTLITIESVD